jgi:bacillithiol system protein YtxJ
LLSFLSRIHRHLQVNFASMIWEQLTEESQLETVLQQSHQQPVVIFKHSTRCSISAMAKSRLERAETPENVVFYFLDLIRYRSVSNRIAEMFQVYHESPQVLLIKNGECVYDESHNGIDMMEIVEQAA